MIRFASYERSAAQKRTGARMDLRVLVLLILYQEQQQLLWQYQKYSDNQLY